MAEELNEPSAINDGQKPISDGPESAPSETPQSGILDEIAGKTVSEHIAATPTAGPKKRGPKAKLRKYPAAGSDTGPGNNSAMGEASGAENELLGGKAPVTPFDAKKAEIAVNGAIGILHGIAKLVVKTMCKKHKCTPEETAEALEQIKPDETAKALMVEGGVAGMEEMNVSPKQTWKGMVLGGLGIWGASVFQTCQAIPDENPNEKAK